MRKLMQGIIACIISISSYAQNGSFSLQQCVEIALNNNIPVKQNELLLQSARADWQKAKANLLPDVNGNWGYGWNQGRAIDPFTNSYIDQRFSSSGAGLSAGLTLFGGLQLQNLIRQTGYAYHASEMEWQQSKDRLTLDVLLAYLTVLNNEDTWRIMSEQAEVTRRQVERLTVMVKEGAVGSYLLSDMKGQLSGDELAAINNYNALQTAKLDLSQLMNIPYNKDMQVERLTEADLLEMYPTNAAEIYTASLQNLAQVKAVDLRVKSMAKGVQAAKGGYYPYLRLNGNLNTNYSSVSSMSVPTTLAEINTGQYVMVDNIKNPVLAQQQNYTSQKISYNNQFKNNLGTYVGLSLNIPIFNNLQVSTNVKKAKLSEKNAVYEAENTKLILKQSIEKAYQDMASAYERYKVLQEQVAQYKESFRSAEIRFNLGTIVSTEYLLTKNNYDRAKLNLTQTWYEYIFRTRILDFYQGKLAL
ncbi:MAG TPA: TolC family protein [Agriterribacter sp.]|uniref:TolC family protein n=2 Tax=Agriterribacter sp. TaxID=2821509 RepID=UPI002C8106AA|nr:TolC family protein [Agriterribacter sp.]HRQ18608.1 TolC family protein [Agriterribacter sp.]